MVAGKGEKVLGGYIDADIGDEGLSYERLGKSVAQLNVLDAGI